jgi:hypothetical protein
MMRCDVCDEPSPVRAQCGGERCEAMVGICCLTREAVCPDCASEWQPAAAMYVSILVDGMKVSR